MIIRKMTACFGQLDGKTLELQPGLNIIEAQNESGKSTWCAFIKTMLYGFEPGARDRADSLTDKTKYRPFSGKNPEGQMTVSHEGRDVVIERTGTEKSPMSKVRVYYEDSGTPVNVSPADLGEMLTGVTRQVFERSSFIDGDSLRITNSPELERHITSLVTTGDDDTSATEAISRLSAWLRRRRGRAGEVPKLQKELQRLSEDIEISEKLGAEAGDKLVKLHEAESAVSELSEELRIHEHNRKAERARAAENAAMLAQNAEKDYNGILKAYISFGAPAGYQIKAARERLISAETLRKSETERLEEAKAEKAECERAIASVRISESNLFTIVGILFFIAGIIGLAVGLKLSVLPVLVASCAVIAAAAVFSVMAFSRRRKNSEEKKRIITERLHLTLAENRIAALEGSLEAISDEISSIDRDRLDMAEKLISELAEADMRRKNAAQLADSFDYPDITSTDILPVHHTEDAAKVLLSEAEARREELLREYNIIIGRQLSLGDPVSIRTRCGEASDRLRTLEGECAAIELAIKTLTESREELSSEFSPMLSKKTAGYLSFITDGRYSSVSVDEALEASTLRSGDVVSHPALYMSTGAYSQLYFALRLAICSLGSDAPLIIDDAFSSFDIQRTAKTMELLEEIAKSRQVIVFSCRSLKPAITD